jgi:AraC family transcriptional regulator
MLANCLATNAVPACGARRSGLPQILGRSSIEQGGSTTWAVRDESRNGPRHRHNRTAPSPANTRVDIHPEESVVRRIASWPGVTLEVVQGARFHRMESRFFAPVHLLAVYEHGMRHEGETFVDGLPHSTLRNLKQKLVFVPAEHEYHDWQEPRILTRVAYFYFDPTTFVNSAGSSATESPLSPRLFFEDDGIWAIALKLMALIDNASSAHQPYAEALGVLLMHELMRLHIGEPAGVVPVRGGLAGWQQRTVVAYIDEHLTEPISLAILAQQARLSPYHFSRAFKQSFGVPPHRFHASRRVDRAKALLANPDQSVTDIGFTLGFNDASSFSAAFRRATGLSPSAYRRTFA